MMECLSTATIDDVGPTDIVSWRPLDTIAVIACSRLRQSVRLDVGTKGDRGRL